MSPLGLRYVHTALAHGGDPDLPIIDHRDTHPLLAATFVLAVLLISSDSKPGLIA